MTSESQLSIVWRRFKRNRLGFAGGIVLGLLVLASIFANLISPYGPQDKHYDCRNEPPGWCNDKFFLFGTDQLGRDLFSRVLMGGRVTLSIGFLVVLISSIFGILLGCLSGYYGGARDTIIQRTTEIIMSIPRLALLVALAYIIWEWAGKQEVLSDEVLSYIGIIFVLCCVNWAPLARVIRGQVLAFREEEFILAARAIGMEDLRIIVRHILPNISGYLIVAATLAIPEIIILESILGFFGYGVQGWVSWGSLLNEGQGKPLPITALDRHPWLFISALFIFIAVLAFNFLGDALRDALDPYAKGV